jgi:hypothetical protein
MNTNFEAALKDEAKKVVRQFHRYSTDQVSTLASHRRTSSSRKCIDRGEFFYTHPDLPGVCFRSRGAAANAAISLAV